MKKECGHPSRTFSCTSTSMHSFCGNPRGSRSSAGNLLQCDGLESSPVHLNTTLRSTLHLRVLKKCEKQLRVYTEGVRCEILHKHVRPITNRRNTHSLWDGRVCEGFRVSPRPYDASRYGTGFQCTHHLPLPIGDASASAIAFLLIFVNLQIRLSSSDIEDLSQYQHLWQASFGANPSS